MTDEQKNDHQEKVEKQEESEQKVDSEQTPLEKSEGKSEEYKSAWQRALADYQNLLKEVASQKSEWAKFSEQQILEEFIPVYDHFKIAFSHHPELNGDQKNIKNWIDGIGYIMKQYGDILKAHGIEEIKTVGEKFDPRVHESAGEEDRSSAEASAGKLTEPGTIIREVSGGYKMGERVIKPARVIICK